jgi:molybdenum cofactor biosynthesis protein A
MQPSVKSKGPADAFGRPLLNLRISVTDRCNLRCRYCMPEEEYVWLPREKLLSFEEISELASIFTDVGIEKVRLTGGEPLLRKDLPVLVRMLAQNPRIRDLALTTNGVLLAGQAQALWDAGLHRLTVSLDTLRPDRFLVLTRRDAHAPVLRGIEAARQAGFRALKIDAVVVRGANEDELADLIEFGKRAGAEVRFIEYMDVGGATQWSRSTVVSRAEILDSVILANMQANTTQKSALGISGHPNSLLSGNVNRSANDGTITRFGWKAQNKCLLELVWSGCRCRPRPRTRRLQRFPRAVERCRPRNSHPEGSQSGVRQAAVIPC